MAMIWWSLSGIGRVLRADRLQVRPLTSARSPESACSDQVDPVVYYDSQGKLHPLFISAEYAEPPERRAGLCAGHSAFRIGRHGGRPYGRFQQGRGLVDPETCGYAT